MPASAGRRHERGQLRRDQKRLSQLLRSIAADIKAASELAASVQRQFAEELEEQQRAAAAEEEDGAIDAELASVLASAVQLRLQLLFEPDGGREAIDLPPNATVADLQAAVHSAGGPVPPLQVLAVGGERLMHLGRTLLRDTRLIRPDVCVTVRRRDPRRTCVDVSRWSDVVAVRSMALLESGEVWCSSDRCLAFIGSLSTLGAVESVHCGVVCCAAIVSGKLQLQADHTRLLELQGAEVVCCSADGATVAVVGSNGQLTVIGPYRYAVPAALDGRVAAVSVGGILVAALTRDGAVCVIRLDGYDWMDLGRAAVAVSAGSEHCAALLDDGSVRCFGGNDAGQCDVPSGLRDVVSVECGKRSTFALHADGRLSWWGQWELGGTRSLERGRWRWDAYSAADTRDAGCLFPAHFSAGRCVAIAAGPAGLLTVSADGRLAHYRYRDGVKEEFARPPSDRVAVVQ